MNNKFSGSKLGKKIFSLLSISALALTGLAAIATPASATTVETLTFDPSQIVVGSGADAALRVVAESNAVTVSGANSHADWTPWPTGDALNADPILVDWKLDGPPWNKAWKVKADVGSDNNVLYYHRSQTAAVNSGLTLLDRTDAQTIISTGNMVVSAKVKALADANVVVKMKLTDTSGASVIQTATTSGTANTWSTLSFDFTTPESGTFDATKAYKKMDLLIDPNNDAAGRGHADWGGNDVATSATSSKLYFIDDVSYTLAAAPGGGGGGAGPTPATLISFETGDNSGYAFSNDWSGATSSVSSTPPSGGSVGYTKAG